MNRIGGAALSLILLVGCRSIPATSGSLCRPPSDESVHAIPMNTLMQLEGNYILTTIATSKGVDHSPELTRLTLTRADTLDRFYDVNVRGHRRSGNRVLVGRHTLGEGGAATPIEDVVVQQSSGSTQMIFGFCTLCFDAQWIYYTITEVRPDGFVGRWVDPQTGIGKLVDRNGRELPNPEGYFCADRVS